MKKLTALFLVMICAIGFVGCNDVSQQVQEDNTENTQIIEVTENSVGEIGREIFSLSVEITEDDANALSEILNSDVWAECHSEYESDCVINLKGHWTYYNSKDGILSNYGFMEMPAYSSKKPEINGNRLVLTEEDKTAVNAILEKYITLGYTDN